MGSESYTFHRAGYAYAVSWAEWALARFGAARIGTFGRDGRAVRDGCGTCGP